MAAGQTNGGGASARVPSHGILLARGVVFWCVMVLSTAVLAPLTLLTLPLPFRIRYGVATQWARFNLRALTVICRLDYAVEGREHIPAGPSIVFCKHQSAWETLALQRIFPPQVWVLKRELLWVPLFGWALALLEPIALNRKAGRRAVNQLVEQGRQRLERGRWVVVFPEGTRVAPGKRGRYRIGGAILAEQTGYTVVPVAHNAGEYWRRRGFIKRPGTIQVVIGEPISTTGRDAAAILAEAETWIESTMDRITTLPRDPTA